MGWIDNADSYICRVCGLEVNNPAKYPNCRCPRCKLNDDERSKAEAIRDDLLEVLKQAKLMGCKEVKSFAHIPMENLEIIIDALNLKVRSNK